MFLFKVSQQQSNNNDKKRTLITADQEMVVLKNSNGNWLCVHMGVGMGFILLQ